jgi:glycosyltransferase involved in cell wall biosynthesis
MGRPIVTTDVPGCREVVDDGVNGLIVAPKDGQALAEGVEALLGSSSLRARFGAAARARAVREFDDKIVTEHMLSLYERLLSGGAAVPHSAS